MAVNTFFNEFLTFIVRI